MPIHVPATLQYVPIQATPSFQQSRVGGQRVSDLDEVQKQRVCDLNAIKRTDKVIPNKTKKLRKQRLSDLNEVQKKAGAIPIGPRTKKTPPRRSTHFNPPVGQQRGRNDFDCWVPPTTRHFMMASVFTTTLPGSRPRNHRRALKT